MNDPHLNLFYTYNRDSELIENNLTRAWIVTLRLLSSETRHRFLQHLFDPPLQDLGCPSPDFTGSHFALQGHFDTRLMDRIPQKYIVTIATERDFEIEEGSPTENEVMSGSSIPDAWIYDPNQGYCFLIEAKVGSNPLDADQVTGHAMGWLGIPKNQIDKHLIPLSWHDVLWAVQKIREEGIPAIEAQFLSEFTQFLSYFGYRLFTGFNFNHLMDTPAFSIFHPG